ncbi:hypothetical protein ACS0TY_033466 [Phlomoides rotata]
MAFNQKLKILVETLNDDLSALRLLFTNPYPIVQHIIQNPTSFGFEHSGKACCGTGRFEMSVLCDQDNPFTCLDANKFYLRKVQRPDSRCFASKSQSDRMLYLGNSLLLKRLLLSLDEEQQCLLATTLWLIWTERNNWLFRMSSCSADDLGYKVADHRHRFLASKRL